MSSQSSMQNANNESHYTFLVLTIIVGLVGVFLRFWEFPHSTLVSNLILLFAAIICLRAVFKILG